MKYLTLFGLSAAFLWAIFRSGGVAPFDWNVALFAIGLVSALHFARGSLARRPLDRLSAVLLAAILALSALQLLPLPLSLVRALSPLRAADLERAATVTGSLPARAVLSSAPWETAGLLLTLAAGVLVLLVVRNLTQEAQNHPWVVTWPLILAGTLQASLGFYQAYAEGGEGLARGTYASRDHYAALLEMILPFALMHAVAILVRDRNRHESPARPALQACFLFACTAVMLVAIIHSLSRMGFLAVLASLFACGAIALTLRGSRVDYEVTPMPFWRRWIPILIVACVVLWGFIFLPTDPLIARFSELARTDDISADTRAQIWRDTIGMVKAYPWVGCGWGAYYTSFLRFKTVAPMNTVDYAHNDYLQVLVEAGPFVFALGLLFILRTLQRTLRAAAYSLAPDERYLAVACAGSFTAILLHSFVDFNMYVPANTMLFAWTLGLASIHLRPRRGAGSRTRLERVVGSVRESSMPEPSTVPPTA